MPLPVVIHLSTKLAVNSGVLTGHVVHIISRTELDRGDLPARLHDRDEEASLLRIPGKQRLPAGCRQRVTQRREDEEEKNEHRRKEGRKHQIKQLPLARIPVR